MSHDRSRHIWLLQMFDLLLTEFDVHSLNHLLNPLLGIQPHNRRRNNYPSTSIPQEYIPSLLNIHAVASWAIEIPFFLAIASTRSIISISESRGLSVIMLRRIPSVSARTEVALRGLARAPRAIGDHGMTLLVSRRNQEKNNNAGERWFEAIPYAELLAGREHFSFLLAIDEVIIILHTDEFGPAVFLGYMLHPEELIRMHT